jgi:hypothetical protein
MRETQHQGNTLVYGLIEKVVSFCADGGIGCRPIASASRRRANRMLMLPALPLGGGIIVITLSTHYIVVVPAPYVDMEWILTFTIARRRSNAAPQSRC